VKLNRHIRAFLSLALAYGLVGALFLGSIASGRTAALPAPVCSAASVNGSDRAPLPAPRDLTCLVAGCCGIATSGLAPAAPSVVSQSAAMLVVWRLPLLPQQIARHQAAAEARAPPVSI
jgi:hypothetical protein